MNRSPHSNPSLCAVLFWVLALAPVQAGEKRERKKLKIVYYVMMIETFAGSSGSEAIAKSRHPSSRICERAAWA